MSNIWFPVPVALFLRRVVNVLSTLSITHHYLLPHQSTDKHSYASELQPQPADKVMLGNRRPYAESYVMWTTIMENSLDGILQGVYALIFFFFFCQSMYWVLTFTHSLSPINSIGEVVFFLVSLACPSLSFPPCTQISQLRASPQGSSKNGEEPMFLGSKFLPPSTRATRATRASKASEFR